jgi:hypothetical protein
MKTRRVPVPGTKRVLTATSVFDTYWRFACERQRVFHARVRGEPPPWTDDPVLSAHRFTNVYRASDRVSQFLIRHVIYDRDACAEDVVFRTLLFKLFNRTETWTHLSAAVGEISWGTYERSRYEQALDRIMLAGERVYSGAYIMPSPALGARRKHANHLRLLEMMMRDDLAKKLTEARSLEAIYRLLLGYPSLGRFLAFQLAIDLNYGALFSFSEMEFVVAGPGARSGLQKCFADTDGLSDEDVIRAVADLAESELARQDLRFADLWGRPLQLIDCQNLFCEVDKYARVVHPDITTTSARARIKQRFRAALRPTPQWYPPKWGIAVPGHASAAGGDAPAQVGLFGAASA